MRIKISTLLSLQPAGADLGFMKGGGLTQGTNLLGRGVQSTLPSLESMLETRGVWGHAPQENFEK